MTLYLIFSDDKYILETSESFRAAAPQEGFHSRDQTLRFDRPSLPIQFHFPWKLTGEISFDDIAAAGGPPDQWDALPTNAKLQIILFIGPRFVFCAPL